MLENSSQEITATSEEKTFRSGSNQEVILGNHTAACVLVFFCHPKNN
jgi:hypothetical protein